MRVDDDIRSDTFSRERHVFMSIRDTDRSFLTMSRSELVSNFGDTSRTNSNLDELESFRVCRQENLIDDTILCRFERSRDISFRVSFESLSEFFRIGRNGCSLSDDDVLYVDDIRLISSCGRNEEMKRGF